MQQPTRSVMAALRILVVDDEESVRVFADRVLRKAGYDVTLVASGTDALVLVEHQPAFDVFVIDLLMPHMTGDELARQVRRINPDAKVLYFTGYSDRLFADKSTLWQDEAFLDKPVNATGLLEAVSLLLVGHTHGLDAQRYTAEWCGTVQYSTSLSRQLPA